MIPLSVAEIAGIVGGTITAGTITAGSETAGTITASSVTAGLETAGTVTAGSETAGSVRAGTVTAGSVRAGTVTAGSVRAGTVTVGSETVGSVRAGTVTAGSVTAGTVRAGTVRAGTVTVGSETAGSVRAGTVTAGTITAGSVTAGLETAGTVTAGSETVGSVRAGTETAGTKTADTVPMGTVPVGAALASPVVSGIPDSNNESGIPEISAYEKAGASIVTGPVVIDSRQAVPGALFAALPGERVDGHDYAAAAVGRGAIAVLAARPLPGAGVPVIVVPDVTAALGVLARAVLGRLPSATVVGITGSSGKTSTKDLTAQVVERLGPTIAPEGSLNNEIGLPLTVLRADETTRYLILEMSARGIGHIAYLTGIAPPKIAAVLNVGRAHAGEFGSIDAVAKAKGELVESLPPARNGGVAVLNADDPNVAAMAARTSARVVTTSVVPTSVESRRDADVRATDISLDDLGRASFGLIMGGTTANVRLKLHGRHHVANALAAAAIAAELGLDASAIAAALSDATARSKKRMELHERPDGVLVVNDAYNANPDSTRAAIEALGHLTGQGRRRRGLAVLGHMAELGEIATESHEEAGRLAAQAGAAVIVAVGEDAAPVLDGARAADGWQGEAIAVPDPGHALAALQNRLRPGDVVLVKASKAAGLWEVADGLLAEVHQ